MACVRAEEFKTRSWAHRTQEQEKDEDCSPGRLGTDCSGGGDDVPEVRERRGRGGCLQETEE